MYVHVFGSVWTGSVIHTHRMHTLTSQHHNHQQQGAQDAHPEGHGHLRRRLHRARGRQRSVIAFMLIRNIKCSIRVVVRVVGMVGLRHTHLTTNPQHKHNNKKHSRHQGRRHLRGRRPGLPALPAPAAAEGRLFWRGRGAGRGGGRRERGGWEGKAGGGKVFYWGRWV